MFHLHHLPLKIHRGLRCTATNEVDILKHGRAPETVSIHPKEQANVESGCFTGASSNMFPPLAKTAPWTPFLSSARIAVGIQNFVAHLLPRYAKPITNRASHTHVGLLLVVYPPIPTSTASNALQRSVNGRVDESATQMQPPSMQSLHNDKQQSTKATHQEDL